MKSLFRRLMLFAIAICAANLLHTEQTLERVEHSFIRLHILANSDSTADQTVKLALRDALTAQAGDWIPAGATWEEGCAALSEALPEIQAVAERALAENGCDLPVQVSFGESDFPVRDYGSCTLPAGRYQALRVEIGAGAGQNWWCVMYPSLCVPAATQESAPLDADVQAMTQEPGQYEVRLKCVDAIRAVVRCVREKLAQAG